MYQNNTSIQFHNTFFFFFFFFCSFDVLFFETSWNLILPFQTTGVLSPFLCFLLIFYFCFSKCLEISENLFIFILTLRNERFRSAVPVLGTGVSTLMIIDLSPAQSPLISQIIGFCLFYLNLPRKIEIYMICSNLNSWI